MTIRVAAGLWACLFLLPAGSGAQYPAGAARAPAGLLFPNLNPRASADLPAVPDLRDLGGVAAAFPPSADPLIQGKTPDAVVDLNAIFNRHWKTADSYQTAAGRSYVSVHFDFKGDPFLSVVPHGWSEPLFYKFEAGMAGAWRAGSEVHRMTLDASLFRSRLNNLVQIDMDGRKGHAYKQKIITILVKAFNAGRTVVIGGRSYRLFFSYAVKHGDPSRIDPKNFGLVFVHDNDPKGGHEFKSFIVNYADLNGGVLGKYLFFNGQKIGLRVPPNTTDLEVYDLR